MHQGQDRYHVRIAERLDNKHWSARDIFIATATRAVNRTPREIDYTGGNGKPLWCWLTFIVENQVEAEAAARKLGERFPQAVNYGPE